MFYLTRWKNYDEEDDTWEPEEHFTRAQKVVNEYWRRGRLHKKVGQHVREIATNPTQDGIAVPEATDVLMDETTHVDGIEEPIKQRGRVQQGPSEIPADGRRTYAEAVTGIAQRKARTAMEPEEAMKEAGFEMDQAADFYMGNWYH